MFTLITCNFNKLWYMKIKPLLDMGLGLDLSVSGMLLNATFREGEGSQGGT